MLAISDNLYNMFLVPNVNGYFDTIFSIYSALKISLHKQQYGPLSHEKLENILKKKLKFQLSLDAFCCGLNYHLIICIRWPKPLASSNYLVSKTNYGYLATSNVGIRVEPHSILKLHCYSTAI